MLIKEKDQNQQQIDYLTDLLERDFSEPKKRAIERELRCLCSGDKGEKTSAYYLEFDFLNSKNWALIHDLRIEHDGQVAQIDHLLIGRMMDCYVIESKNFNSGVLISDEGDFSYFYKNKPYSIPSPIEQNERHIRLLDRFLSDNKLFPSRLGVALKPNYRNIVLISPTSRLTKPKKGLFDCSAVMKADKFVSHFKKDIETSSLSSITKVMSSDSLMGFAEKLAFLHEPKAIDYRLKFSLDEHEEKSSIAESENAPECPKCNKGMVKRTVKKGKNIGDEFWGCSQYPKCKGVVDIKKNAVSEAAKKAIKESDTPECPECNKPMTKRTATKGDNKGNKFWGCSDFPKCKATLKVDVNEVPESVAVKENKPDAVLCPKCSGSMVKRISKKGDNTGNEFWGCSKFPKCRGVLPVK